MMNITTDKVQFTDPMKYQKLFEKMHEDIATAFQTRASISVEEKNVPRQSKRKKIEEIPIWEKSNLTIQEAAVYSGIGEHRLRSLTEDENCGFVIWVGRKRLIKRRQLDEYLDKAYSI